MTGRICAIQRPHRDRICAAVARQRRPVPHQKRCRRRADEQRLHAGVGAEVDTVQRRVRDHQARRDRRCRRTRDGDADDDHPDRAQRRLGVPVPGDQGEQYGDGNEHQRPHDVVLLLHRERPGVLQRRRGVALREVVRVAEHEDPVGRPEEGGDRVVAHGGDRVGREQLAQHDDRHHHDDQRGQQPSGAAHPKPGQVNRAGAAEFVEKQRGDQESAQHEEHIDADEPAGDTGNAAVVGEHQRDRQSADAVQRGDASRTASATPRSRRRPWGAPVDGALGRRDPPVATHRWNLSRASRRKSPRHAECRGAFATGYLVSAMYFVSRYSSMPSKPPSLPKPDSLTPPNGAAGSEMTPRLTPTMPASMPSETRRARSRSRV